MLKLEKPLEGVWKSAAYSSLSAGNTSEVAIHQADDITMAYDARFCPQTEDKMNATYSLEIAIKYIERSSLCGKKVLVMGTTDVPGVGVIKDFRNETQLHTSAALIKWESGGPEGQPETWTTIDRLQLIAQFGA